MFPIEFEHSVLENLPLPLASDVDRVAQVLKSIVVRRVMPYFKKKRGTDAISAAQVAAQLSIERLEDDKNLVRAVGLVGRGDGGWVIHVHERVFDYLVFVLPRHVESTLAEAGPEQRTMLAFAEFMLRHEIQHILYPEDSEIEVILSDVAFAMDRRANDPTFYLDLRSAFADQMNGLKGGLYLRLLDNAEREQPLESVVSVILNEYAVVIGDFPEAVLQSLFPSLCTVLKTRILGFLFQRSRDTVYPLLRRTSFLQKFLRLFELLLEEDERTLGVVFDAFKERWGIVALFQELGIPETSVEQKTNQETLRLFKTSLKRYSDETKGLFCGMPSQPVVAHRAPKAAEPEPKSLMDRIAEVREDPRFPGQVLQIIEKNKLSTSGHSGQKYTELIETLLAVPWGKTCDIGVSVEDFAEGLDRTHYGLEKPKQSVLDFFSTLIWRRRHKRRGIGAPAGRSGSAFLFVGPPGVGKTSLAISIAENLGVPFHKLSLGGMRDEADLRGHGFTYEGSKPGAIVQGLIKMGCMNGMFIMDEADKTEKFAIATLLEILDPEQNHLFHDRYMQTTVDIDLSNCHFILTANTLETVPPPIINRCEVVFLDRYSIEEKIAIAREHLIRRVRDRYEIDEDVLFFETGHETGLLKYLIKSYTHEAGVRELERVIRTLFMRSLRKEIMTARTQRVKITRQKIGEYLELPRAPRRISEDDRVGEIVALGINVERGIGTIIPIQATEIRMSRGKGPVGSPVSMVHATGNIERVMDESRKVATTAILHCAKDLGISLDRTSVPIHLHFMGGSTPKDGPSAGGAIALALASLLSGRPVRKDVAMTGEIDTQGRITTVGGLEIKLETAYDAGCRTMIIPKENLFGEGGVERLSPALKQELQVLSFDEWEETENGFDYTKHVLQIVGCDHLLEAAQLAFIDESELVEAEEVIAGHARSVRDVLKRAGEKPAPLFRVVYVKDPKELGANGVRNGFWEQSGSVFLVTPRVHEAVGRRFPSLEREHRLWDFDPKLQEVTSVLRKMAEMFGTPLTMRADSWLAAPYFFLHRDKERLYGFSPGPWLTELKLFANNYTRQGVKIRGSKAVLNRVSFYLSQLEPQMLDACPFLSMRDRIYVLDMSFIPEKYRLDLKRAEELVISSLERWLAVVEGDDKSDESALAPCNAG